MTGIQKKKLILLKELILLFAVILCAALFGLRQMHAAAVTRESAQILQVNLLAEFPVPEGGSYAEGGTVIPSGYLLSYLSKVSSQPNPLQLLNVGNWSVAATASAMLAHSNDMCHIPKRGEIYVTPMNRPQLVVLNDTDLTVKCTLDVPQNYHAIGYDSTYDFYAGIYVTGTGAERELYCDILDGTCRNELSTFSTDSNLTYQGLAVKDSMVFYACWERGTVNAVYEPVYDGVFQPQDNVIYVYDYYGNLLRTLLIPMPEGYSKFELEGVSFLGDRMILQFNELLADKPNERLVGIYEVTGGYVTPGDVAAARYAAQSLEAERKAAEEEAARKAAEEEAARKAEEEAARKAEEEAARKAEEEAAAAAEREAAEEKAAKERAAFRKTKKAFAKARTKITDAVRRKKSLKLQWKKLRFGGRNVTEYEVQICRRESFRGKTLRKNRAAGSRLTIRGLNRRTAYYIRIRACYVVDGKTYYSAWSKTKKLKTM